MKTAKLIKCFSVLLSVVLVLVTVVSCGNTTAEPGNDATTTVPGSEITTETTAATNPVEETIQLVSGGIANFTIVFPENGTAKEKSTANTVYDDVYSLTGASAVMMDDFIRADGEHDSTTVEILVGTTNYKETAQALSEIGYGDYSVSVIGKKIVVAGFSDEALGIAALKLKSLMRSNFREDNSLSIPANTKITGTALSIANNLPKITSGDGVAILTNCGDECITATVNGITKEEAYGYCDLVASKGFTKYDSHDIINDKNFYAAYSDGTNLVTVVWSEWNNRIRVMVEPLSRTATVPLTAGDYTKVCEPLAIQIGVARDNDSVWNGMSYVFRLADGRFVVYDGGYDDTLSESMKYKRNNAKNILDILKQYAPDASNIRIAAWIITHGHTDHIGALECFADNYLSDSVKLESVILNLPSGLQASQPTNGSIEDKIDKYRGEINALRNAGTVIYKAHCGQIFRFADAVIEVLYSYEMSTPDELASFNSSSVVTRITLGNQKFMMGGDMTGVSGALLVKMFGQGIKSDFMQVPHHGYYASADTAFYSQTAPLYLLWPVSASNYQTAKSQSVNSILFSANSTVKQIFVAEYKVTVFSLPFTGTNLTVTPIE